MSKLLRAFYRYFILVSVVSTISLRISAQSENFSTGSFIINMGASNPNTVANGLKPYGLIYDLIRNYQVPVKWVISQTKLKDGVDFIYNNVQYKGGTFIIPAEYRTAAVNNRITYWTGLGVMGITTTTAMTLDVTVTINAFPRWTLDATNGRIAEAFLLQAGINNTDFPNAYNWKLPSLLDCCDDYFVMPHADPTWATHGNLLAWNKNCLGSIWAGCHAVSVLENMTNPSDATQKTNFLSNPNLLLFGSHSGGSVPYTHQLFGDPVAQYMGPTDLAQLNGSEQIYMPAPGGSWRPTTQIIAYDPSQVNVPGNSPGPAALIVYGRGMGDPTRGYVMYEAGHNINGGTVNSIAAMRAFFNFSFFQTTPKSPHLTVTGVVSGQQITNGSLLNLSVTATSPLIGISFTYQWSSSNGGTFSAPTSANTTFNPPTTPGVCVITCLVSDNCGRQSFSSFPVTVLGPPTPPTVADDAAAISGSCQAGGAAVTVDVLANDVPNSSIISFTGLNLGTASPANAGTWTSTPAGLVTFTPDPNFNGLASITYTVTNTQGITNTATINVTVGNTDANGCTSNQVYAPQEVDLLTLANFVRQNSTGAVLNGAALDDNENTFATAGTDYLSFGTSANDSLVLAIGSTVPLRAKDTINIYWSKNNASAATLTVRIGASSTGPWTNPQLLTNSSGSSGVAGATVSQYIIPAGVSGITYVSLRAGNPPTNSAGQVWVDAVEYEYLSCVARQPDLTDDAAIVLEDAPAILNVQGNDDDPQGLPLTIKQITVQPTKGKASINLDGTITYISNKDVNGTDAFTYQACNTQGFCSTAVVNVTITPDGCAAGFYKANPPSGAVTKIFQYLFAGTNAATANSTAANFADSYLNQANTTQTNGTGTKTVIGYQFSGTKAERAPYYFNISEIPAGSIVQSAVFSTMRVGGNNTNQTVFVHTLTNSFTESQVSWANRSTGPIVAWTAAGGDYNATAEASVLVKNTKVFYNWSIATAAQGWINTPATNLGLLQKTGETVNAGHQFATKENGTATSRPKLTITYVVPDPCSAIPNRAPLANPDVTTVVNGGQVVFNPLPNDADVDPGNVLTVTGVYGISAGSATFTASAITYTANINATVPRTETLKYIVSDNNGAKDTAIVYITVTNAPPSANSDVAATNSGAPVTIPVMANDFDPEGGAITSPVITLVPKYGTATVVGNTIQYTPGTGYSGKDTLIYQVCESAIGGCSAISFCDTALVVITVNNQPPSANPDSKTATPCQTTIIPLITNDTDPEGGSLTVTNISALSNPAAGTLVNNNDGSVSFTPTTSYAGPPVTFTYTVTDNGTTPAVSAPATVTITVTAIINNPPVAVNDIADSSHVDENVYYSVLDNDSDPDNNPLSNPTITVNPTHGTVTVLPNGLIEYTPDAGFYGSDSLTYQVCDITYNPIGCIPAIPLCATAKLYFNIIAPPIVVAINELSSFTGTANKCDAVLQWKASTETNADKFVVEKSSNGLNFVAVAEVRSAGGTVVKTYHESVSQPSGIMYYRLKLLHGDGRFSYSPVVAVHTACGADDYLAVYPNPASTTLTVSFHTAYRGTANLVITNTVGQKLLSQKIQVGAAANAINLDLSNYSPGIYMLFVADGSGVHIGEPQKVIKN